MEENKQMIQETVLPAGFEKHPEGENIRYRTGNQAQSGLPAVNFRGGPGGPGRGPGGPGRNMGREVEKAADVKKTLSRLLKYFGKEKKLLLLLMTAVVLVTLAGIVIFAATLLA